MTSGSPECDMLPSFKLRYFNHPWLPCNIIKATKHQPIMACSVLARGVPESKPNCDAPISIWFIDIHATPTMARRKAQLWITACGKRDCSILGPPKELQKHMYLYVSVPPAPPARLPQSHQPPACPIPTTQLPTRPFSCLPPPLLPLLPLPRLPPPRPACPTCQR
jgi:hypothetical protein